MNDDRLCSQSRETAVETGLNGLPEELRRHVDSCGPCRRYLRSVETLKRTLEDGALYTPSLRMATLRAVDARAFHAPDTRWPFLLVPVGLILNMFLSVVLPAGLFHEILPSALGRTAVGAALSLLAAVSVGTATALICFFSMKTDAFKEVRHV